MSCRQVADEAEVSARAESRSSQQFWVITDAREGHVCRGHDDQSAVENRQVQCNEAADWSACRPITRHSGNIQTLVVKAFTAIVAIYNAKLIKFFISK